jgi:alpha-mannosidase
MPKRVPLAATVFALTAGLATVSTQNAGTTLYMVATAHLDSQWNWTVQDTIRQFVPSTFYTNFKYFEKYPDYVFTWEGAIHYMWFKEYHPDDWPTVQKYVAARRWRLAGSWLNAVDTNMPSPESLFRQALYAKRFFRQEFGTVSQDVYLPDCFGFGFALPSIAAHSGLKAFSTQKLTWGRPIPFPVGRWQGVDGSEILAELNPGSYTTRVETDPTTDPKWTDDATPVGGGKSVVFRYFGTGDTGGGPTEESVANVEHALQEKGGAVDVRNTSADQMSRDLTPAEFKALPLYTGELILKTHGTGCYTAQAAMKRFNRQNELLADGAEKSAVAAAYLTGLPYPTERLRESWTRFLWHQFHDDLTGTCIPQAYQFSWNDEITSMNQFAGVLTSSTTAASSQMKTSGTGTPLVIFNPLSTQRHEPVEATVHMTAPPAASLSVVDAETGETVPAQVLERTPGSARVLFMADVPAVGFKVVHVRAAAAPKESEPSVSVTENSLENNRLSVKIDRNGDISSIYDKDAKRELLRAPIMLELRDDPSANWPAWEVLYDTVQAPAREYVSHPAMKVIERGPVRAAIEITRHASGSTFVQRVSLAAGGDRVDVENLVDWQSPNSLLKVSFPVTASNPKATYDLGVGVIERTGNEPDKYEVPAQKWADVTDTSGSFGVGIINDSKYGWDKPDDGTLRLTLLHTPRPTTRYTYQSSNDLGHHRFVFAVAGHAGDWRQGQMPVRAAELNQPLRAFEADPHAGAAGASFSMASLDDPTGEVAITALKHAEDSDEIVVRLQERYGRTRRVTLRMPSGIVAAREINAAEEDVAPIDLSANGGGGRGNQGPRPTLALDFKAYQPRTLALKLAPRAAQPVERASAPVDLPFDLDGVSTDKDRGDGDFDGKKHTISAELLPHELNIDGVSFTFGSGAPGQKNVVVPNGQVLRLPDGNFTRLYLIAAAVGEDVRTTIAGQRITVREWQGPVGQWWSRLKAPSALWEPFVPAIRDGQTVATVPSQREIQDGLVVQWDPKTGVVSGIDQLRPAFLKRDEIAWVGSHRHAPEGNEVYVASYLFLYGIDLPEGTREVRLPSDKRLRILAASVSREPRRVRPAGALYLADFASR